MKNSSSLGPLTNGAAPVSDLLDQVQQQLNKIKLRFQNGSVESYFVQLEKRHYDLERSSKWLEDRNEELERRVRELEKRLGRVIQERDDREEKLKLYSMVIRDALNDTQGGRALRNYEVNKRSNSDLKPPHQSEGSNWGILQEAQGLDHAGSEVYNLSAEDFESELDALEVRNQLLPRSASPSEPSTTTRVARPVSQNEPLFQNEPGPSRISQPLSTCEARVKDEPTEETSPASDHDVELNTSDLADPQALSTRFVENASEVGDGDGAWRVYFDCPPKVAEIVGGPISWRNMEDKAGLDHDAVRDLKKLLVPSSFKLGVAFMTDIAFVHDPFFLEDPARNKSYLIDWGDKRANEKLAQCIRKAGEYYNSVFHTFVYVAGRKRWFYVSALRWRVEKALDVWPTLPESDKESIGSRLCYRNQSVRQTETIMENLDSGELQQFSVELSASEHLVEFSRERAASMGLRVGS